MVMRHLLMWINMAVKLTKMGPSQTTLIQHNLTLMKSFLQNSPTWIELLQSNKVAINKNFYLYGNFF